MKKLFLILICLPLFLYPQSEKKLALVIGNSNYETDSWDLKNPINDALLIASTLDSLGFEVELDTNLTMNEFYEVIQEFRHKRKRYDLGFVYYAGHGTSINNENYLIPTDANSDNFRDYAVSLQDVIQAISDSSYGNNIFVFDSDRSDIGYPSRDARNSASPSGEVGTFIAFSSDIGQVAEDGSGDNSSYCESLCRNLLIDKDIEIEKIFRNVRIDVMNATDGRQIPVVESRLIDDIYLNSSYNRSVMSDDYIEEEKTFRTGIYYALIIGVQEYDDKKIENLDNPIMDAQKLYNVLTSRYNFDIENIRFIKNPTRLEIINQFDYFSKIVSEDANFLIFYAGHGYWDDQMEQGYWLAKDAQKDMRGTWILNDRIKNYIKGIKSKNTLLISDACFSGSIFKTRNAFSENIYAMYDLYHLPSRKAMTSGNMTKVPDKSIFLEYLVKSLSINKDKYLSSEKLFGGLKLPVMYNTETVPQFGSVHQVGDEGGDFIFERR